MISLYFLITNQYLPQASNTNRLKKQFGYYKDYISFLINNISSSFNKIPIFNYLLTTIRTIFNI